MAQPQTLNAEYDELMARADEIEQPLPSFPSVNPQGPCALWFVDDAAQQLALSADSLRLYLNSCEREWKILAQSLRNAAKAYEEVDEEAAEAINNDSATDVSPSVAGSAGGDGDPDEPTLPPQTPTVLAEEPEDFYYDVKDAATIIEAGDQGAEFVTFVQGWTKFQMAFQNEKIRFRPFTSWEGDARDLVELNFEQQMQWIDSMVQSCITLVNQATGVLDAHKKAKAYASDFSDGGQYEHPTSYEVAQCEMWYKRYQTENPEKLHLAVEWYDRLQRASEESLSNYRSNGSLPLTPVSPRTPASAVVLDPPADAADAGSGDDGSGDAGAGDLPADDWLTDPLDTTAPLSPATSGMPTNPTPADSLPTDTWAGMSGPSTGSGIKPASFGGGGPSMGGIPSMPLQAPVEAEAAARAAAPRPAGLTGIPPAGAMAGRGGGMGMMPMAPGAGAGQDQGKGKGKRIAQNDQALYTEKRPWTSSIIGNRRRNDTADSDDSQMATTARR